MLPSLFCIAPIVLAANQEAAAPAEVALEFPSSTALAEGLSPDALGRLDALVQSFVDEGDVVGAELHVIKNGRTVLHEGYGLAYVESEAPLEPDSVFCVRSMTKPLIGLAVLMLVDDDALELDDAVSKYVPAFDTDGSREITVLNLLQHTGGLPMSLIMAMSLDSLESIDQVAGMWADHEPEFEPGSAFQYSDQGTDTLTALVQAVSGVPAAQFIEQRVLGPLGMRDSATVMALDHRLRERALPKYAGSRGAWTRFWSPADEPLFSFFLGSQGLYSTTTDYARFLRFWMERGRVDGEKLLGTRYVRRAIEPGPYPMGGPTGFEGLRTDYGYLMQLWTAAAENNEESDEDRDLVAFGHTGSDGTHAWAFPEQDAMVLYFTQSRGTLTGLRVEEALDELLLGAPFDPNEAAPPLEPYLGYYWEGPNDKYRAIVLDEGRLTLEVPGRALAELVYVGDDRWKIRREPGTVIAFDRDEEGAVTGYHIGEHQEFRLDPTVEYPEFTAGEVAASVSAFHRMDLLESAGPVRIESTLEMEKLGRSGTTTTLLAWPGRYRFDGAVAGETETLTYDGQQVWYSTTALEPAPLDGLRAEQARTGHALARFGDWSAWYPGITPIQIIEDGDMRVLAVRMGDATAPASTLMIDTSDWSVFREDTVSLVDGLGRVGQRIRFGDYREVGGMQLPHKTGIEFANSMIGTLILTVQSIELGADLPADAFTLSQ